MNPTMSPNSILSTLQRQLGSGTIQQMSEQLGTDSGTTASAISTALPVLLGALSRNASNPQGAADLDDALNAHDGSILDNLGGLIGNAGGGAGAAILGHILGGRRSPVEQGVGRASGMSAQQVSQLLIMLAPIVMGVLGRMKQNQGLDANQLPQALNQSTVEMEKQAPATAGLGRMLDMNKDGEIADDIARMGSSILGGLFGKRI